MVQGTKENKCSAMTGMLGKALGTFSAKMKDNVDSTIAGSISLASKS